MVHGNSFAWFNLTLAEKLEFTGKMAWLPLAPLWAGRNGMVWQNQRYKRGQSEHLTPMPVKI
jgi:hypothetical protein